MNLNKARDFYSAYYEGTLEPGLKQALEAARLADPEIEQDYREFEILMHELPNLAVEPIEIPHDLHEKISARLDNHVWQAQQEKPKGWGFNWKIAFAGALACVALAAAVISFRPTSDQTNTAGGLSLAPARVDARFEMVEGALALNIRNDGPVVVTISRAEDGAVIGQRNLTPGRIAIPLKNENDKAEVLNIGFDRKDLEPLTIVLPGKVAGETREGEGSLLDCAKAVSQTFRTPIIIRTKNPDARVTWSFTAQDSSENLVQALARNNINATTLESRILVFQP